MSAISERVKTDLDKLGLSYRRLADLCGVPVTTVWRFLAGDNVGVNTVERITDAVETIKGKRQSRKDAEK